MSNGTNKVALVYFSGSGHTHLMAEGVARGARKVAGVEVDVIRIDGDLIQKGRYSDDAALARLTTADAIIFGTPTYMGGPSAQFKAFADATGTIWYQRGWKGKLAGGFTHSGTPSGDKFSTMTYLQTLANQHGMLWVSNDVLPAGYTGRTDNVNRLGFYSGAAGVTPFNPGAPASVDPADNVTAEEYGQHVAEVTRRVSSKA